MTEPYPETETPDVGPSPDFPFGPPDVGPPPEPGLEPLESLLD